MNIFFQWSHAKGSPFRMAICLQCKITIVQLNTFIFDVTMITNCLPVVLNSWSVENKGGLRCGLLANVSLFLDNIIIIIIFIDFHPRIKIQLLQIITYMVSPHIK